MTYVLPVVVLKGLTETELSGQDFTSTRPADLLLEGLLKLGFRDVTAIGTAGGDLFKEIEKGITLTDRSLGLSLGADCENRHFGVGKMDKVFEVADDF